MSEIDFCTLYVVAERWILACTLRFVRANNDFSDTLRKWHFKNRLLKSPAAPAGSTHSKLDSVVPALRALLDDLLAS